MRILLVHNRYINPGGEDFFFQEEKKLLEDHGHEIHVYERNNQEILNYPFYKKLSLLTKTVWSGDSFQDLHKLIKDIRPNVAHFTNTFPLISPSAYYACQEFGTAVVQSLHNYRLICPAATLYRQGQCCEACVGKKAAWPGIFHGCYHGSIPQTTIISFMLFTHHMIKTWQNSIDTYVALTEFSRKKFIEGGLPSNKIMVKPIFLRKDPGCKQGKDEGYALYLGRLTEEKGIKTLLDAWQQLPEIPLKIGGDGTLKEQLQSSILQGNLNHVEYLGWLTKTELIPLIKKARFLLCPSEWYEGFPMTILEAFACGVPTIASRLGSMAEVIEDKITGLLFEPGDPDDLVRTIHWAMAHQEDLLLIGQRGRALYENKFTAEKNYRHLLNIYLEAIKVRNTK